MNDNERFKIISDDFADIVIEYNNNMSYFERFGEYSYNLINDKYAIIHIPAEALDENAIRNFGYFAIPKCYGLLTYLKEQVEREYTVRSFPEYNLTGSGVLVGIIDTGIVYTNPIFINADNTSKVKAIWDQTIDSGRYPEGMFYGTEYSQEEISHALASETPLQIVPSTDTIGQGTAMAGIAAGYQSEDNGFSGVAVGAELVVVKLKQAKNNIMDFYGIPQDTYCYQMNDIMMGIQYLMNLSRRLNRPIVICVGLGSSQGSHKGEDIMSNYLTESATAAGIAIVVAAGNEGDTSHHYFGEIVPPEPYDLVELKVGPLDRYFSMELWGYLPNVVTVEIINPDGDSVAVLRPDFVGQRNYTIEYQEMIIYVDSYISETYSEEQLILFRFKNIPEGIWRFRTSGTYDLISQYHIWLPIRNFLTSETYFHYANPFTTISIPGNALNILTTTSYNPISRELSESAGRGFTASFVPKPDIAAPGEHILVPTIINTFIPLSGTSLASAFAGGISAGLLEWGILQGNMPGMNSISIRYFLTNSAVRSNEHLYPNPGWGYGLIE
ncbi:hypothetical protein acsn021_23130 [Anaerocolumna cellulosilytica]|uniref:Peptidase S8/S53 domain-containing protein n=1 Tax=Anaerocolumna cellulosilytica TaxID=433286 RepID=A0A6S6QVX1_9FIRM|nr:S8 family peptidase [Anaerocolumna cellulosilytica]MBB5194042.1 subtilisin family serine protease [Anaerocolumna cellulosilytica]BCJ94744.1 hypothetical protein acsn021_23130 [Anaerocolumna cellulosilytica]